MCSWEAGRGAESGPIESLHARAMASTTDPKNRRRIAILPGAGSVTRFGQAPGHSKSLSGILMDIKAWVTPTHLAQFASLARVRIVLVCGAPLQEALQPGSGDAEPAGGLRAVPARRVEHRARCGALDFCERGRERDGARGTRRPPRGR